MFEILQDNDIFYFLSIQVNSLTLYIIKSIIPYIATLVFDALEIISRYVGYC